MSNAFQNSRGARPPVILFIGAGFSFTSGVRIAKDLGRKVLEEIQIGEEDRQIIMDEIISDGALGIQELADYLERTAPGIWYSFKDAIAQNLHSQSPIISPEYRMLAFLIKKKYVDAVYTTNQDVCLERALDAQGISYNRFVYPYVGNELRFHANGNVDIIKLCGDIHTPYEMCFSEEELESASESQLFESLLNRFNKNCRIIFIGYSAYKDPIGERLRTASEERCRSKKRATIYCVDKTIKQSHYELINNCFNDCIIEKTAETYLREAIYQIRPRIKVKHALMDMDGFGGIQTYAYSLMELCKKYEPQIVLSEYATRDFYHKSELKRKPAYGIQYALASGKAKTISEICTDRPDVIHAHSYISAHMAVTLGMPCVLSSHSLESKELEFASIDNKDELHDKQDPFESDIKKTEMKYYSEISDILALSQSHINEMPKSVQHYVQKTAAPFLSPESLNVDTNVTSAEKRGELIERGCAPQSIIKEDQPPEFQKDRFTIAFFGRPAARKGLKLFDEVIQILDEKASELPKEFQVLYVGPDITADGEIVIVKPEKSSYNPNKANAYKLERSVPKRIQERMFTVSDKVDDPAKCSFVEHLRRIYEYYLASDVIVMPSSYETFGYVALEAMACRRPVIASKINGLIELLADDRGYLIDICDSNLEKKKDIESDFASAVSQIMMEGRKEQVKKAKAWVDETYSPKAMQELVEDVYLCYLGCIIRGKKAEREELKQIEYELKNAVGTCSQWEELLLRSADVYQKIKMQLSPSPTADMNTEYYDLLWNIAYWLKSNKSTCPEVGILPIKELAELITQVARFVPKDEKFYGRPCEIKLFYDKYGNKHEIKIGVDGRAERARHYTNHGRPDIYTIPHDHIISWSDLNEEPQFGETVNYWEKIPIFEEDIEKRVMQYTLLPTGTDEQNRFRSTEEFVSVMKRYGEVVFAKDAVSYSIIYHSKKYRITCMKRERPEEFSDKTIEPEYICDNIEDLLMHTIDEKTLGEIITKVCVEFRSM